MVIVLQEIRRTLERVEARISSEVSTQTKSVADPQPVPAFVQQAATKEAPVRPNAPPRAQPNPSFSFAQKSSEVLSVDDIDDDDDEQSRQGGYRSLSAEIRDHIVHSLRMRKGFCDTQEIIDFVMDKYEKATEQLVRQALRRLERDKRLVTGGSTRPKRYRYPQ